MLYQIISFLLDVAVGLLGGACLLRLYMQWQRVPFGNPVGRFVFALTNWLVLPLRKMVPAIGRLDTASLVAAFALVLVERLLLWMLQGTYGNVGLMALVAFFDLLRLVITCMTGLVIVYAVLSWIQTDSPIADLLARMVTPMLRPIRSVVPLVGGVDLSPLVLLVLLQIVGIVLNSVQRALMA
jgi:YggT family protein